MTKRLTFNKITRIILFLFALLPFIALFAIFIKVHFVETESALTDSVSKQFEYCWNFVSNGVYFSVYKLPWYDSLKNILVRYGFMGIAPDNRYISFAYTYLNYLFELMFLDLVFQCFTFFISLIRHAVEKLGGDF